MHLPRTMRGILYHLSSSTMKSTVGYDVLFSFPSGACVLIPLSSQDYEGFDEANENDCLEEFLKLPRGSLPQVPVINHSLSNFSSRDASFLSFFHFLRVFLTVNLHAQVSLEKEVVVPQLNGAPSPRQTPELDVVPGNGQVEEEEFVQDDVQDTGADDAGDSGAGGDGGKFNFDQLLLGFFPIWGRCGVPFHISCLIGDWFFLFKNPVVQHKTN